MDFDKSMKENLKMYVQEVEAKVLELVNIQRRCGNHEELTLSMLEAENKKLYQNLVSDNYSDSYANPERCVKEFGKTVGRTLCALYSEIYSMIPYVYEGMSKPLVYIMELFVEIVNLIEQVPDALAVKRALFYYPHAYCGEFILQRIHVTRPT